MIYKICRKCKKIIVHPATYCNDCLAKVNLQQQENKRIREKNYNSKRDPKYKAFYNSEEWKLLKDKKMQDEQYRCERCGNLAEEVHHIEPIQTDEGWEKRLEYDNLECLCIECHNYRHKRFQRKKKKT